MGISNWMTLVCKRWCENIIYHWISLWLLVHELLHYNLLGFLPHPTLLLWNCMSHTAELNNIWHFSISVWCHLVVQQKFVFTIFFILFPFCCWNAVPFWYINLFEYPYSMKYIIFLISSSEEYSWKRTKEQLMEVARLGEDSGYGVPCLLIAAKDDLKPYTIAVQDSARVHNFLFATLSLHTEKL